MSFNNFDVEAQTQRTRPETLGLDQTLAVASSQLAAFATSIASLGQLIGQIGSPKRDSTALRIRIEGLAKECSRGELLTKNALHTLANQLEPADAQQRFTEEKLKREFGGLVHVFNKVQNDYTDRKQAYPLVETVVEPVRESERAPLIQQQVQMYTEVSESDLLYQSALTEARETEIGKIQTGIQEVNTIFRDLSQLVKQQGELVDTVEGNMGAIALNTADASHELTRAETYQKARGRWCCFLLVFLAVMLVVILAILS
ncbi:hypothetical protein BABINDRAFT_31743 [Babjeviella inositovora NRRL Y-12698]|uniref:t-SNARE coiled-coil homology domain-containing protein n=1 Tax=Babjeviella inositovora NRRL Y-12698 TaxID=984486 RepID=A0A1E3QYR3_9ASCO|nr:uncharacterized protein BABINDRAFT_31743 [Babjeviella inositovora NRRL Y-12698]ODQ82694.1 hypothetical protein BABINDRAFT_31743 [Babjeviella inositovora NRRL Y-12698]